MRLTTLSLVVLLAAPAVARAQLAEQRFPSAEQPDTLAQAIDYGDFYYTRLTIHRYGSYAMLPLFAAQVYLGEKLIKGGADEWVKPTHQLVAGSIGTLFVVNTITGAWNLWDSRKDPDNRTHRYIHAALMTAAEAGFVYTGFVAAREAHDLGDGARRHRDAAAVSMSVATLGGVLMWVWNH